MDQPRPTEFAGGSHPTQARRSTGRAVGLPGEDELPPVNQVRDDQFADLFVGGERIEAGVAVLRDLLRVETDRDRFRQILLAWEEQLVAAVLAEDPAGAEAWLRAVVTAPIYRADMSDLVESALDEVSVPEVLDRLVVCLAAAAVPGTGAGLVGAWGPRMAGYLVRAMIVEQPPVSRRHLTEFLAWVGKEDIRLLTAWRRDPHWYVLRNLAIALGRTGLPAAIPTLESMLGHADHRVRVEVLRSLWTLRGDEAVPVLAGALADPEPRVRHAACSLLRASPGPVVVPVLVGILESRAVEPSEVARLVELIAERSDPAVPGVLAHLARHRRLGSAGRAVRRAARAALAQRPPGTGSPAGPGAPATSS